VLALGQLYVVATPIGNLEDITLRALTVLKEVDLIAAEDTRQSKKLLNHYGILTPLFSLHAHNEKKQSEILIKKLLQSQNVAYISDAGTPLISDPGAYLVKKARAQGIRITPVPGACAAIAALSISGILEQPFYFEGFLPHQAASRKKRLKELKELPCTLIFYEAPHRILHTLQDGLSILGNRQAMIARELTKRHETIYEGSLEDLFIQLSQKEGGQKGEFVVILSAHNEPKDIPLEKINQVLTSLLTHLPTRVAADVVSDMFGVARNLVYKKALALKKR
jgi:16S rRNA (cytidine1402-2'-O)-methyltransferase